jgi:hypothetical protein
MWIAPSKTTEHFIANISHQELLDLANTVCSRIRVIREKNMDGVYSCIRIELEREYNSLIEMFLIISKLLSFSPEKIKSSLKFGTIHDE